MAEKPKTEKKKDSQSEEKVLIIPLRRKARRSAKNRRMNRSVREIKIFLAKHTGAELSNVSISQQLNESLWKGGYHNPPSSIRVKVSSDEEGNVLARLIDEKERPRKERKSRLGLRERLRRKASETPSDKESVRSREEAKEEKDSGKKPASPTSNDKEEKKPEPPKEKPKEPPKEEIEQDTVLEQ